jgi:hypothetical protein
MAKWMPSPTEKEIMATGIIGHKGEMRADMAKADMANRTAHSRNHHITRGNNSNRIMAKQQQRHMHTGKMGEEEEVMEWTMALGDMGDNHKWTILQLEQQCQQVGRDGKNGKGKRLTSE